MYYRLTVAQFKSIPEQEYTHSPTFNLAGTECILDINGSYVPQEYLDQYPSNADVKAYWATCIQDWEEEVIP
jgi:hypothetical protein